MFIKEAYQRRIADQKLQSTTLQRTKANRPPKIGSARYDKINYSLGQQFFTHDDISQKGKIAQQFKRNFVDPDILQLKKKEWNISVSVPKRFEQEQSLSRKLLHIRKGMNDFTQIPYRPNKVYQGTQVRNDFSNWNVSTFVTKKQIQSGLLKTNLNAWDNSGLYSLKVANYLKPIQRFRANQKERKKNNQKDISLSLTLKSSYQVQDPYASPQKTNAVVFKRLQQTRRIGLKNDISSMETKSSLSSTFKAKLSPTQKQKVTVKYHHTGIWQKVKCEADNQLAWSCCMNQNQKSEGCVKTVIDGNRLNFASYNNA